MKVNIANTDLEPLSRLGLGTVGAGTKWSGTEAGRPSAHGCAVPANGIKS